jgi:hypothetical protein
MTNECQGMKRTQYLAITEALELAIQLQKDYPQIADMYREGKTRQEISDELRILSQYGIKSENVAVRAVGHALAGYTKPNFPHPFEGLMPGSELERLSREHIQTNGHEGRIAKKGVFSLTPEQTRANAILGGQASYENGLGINGYTPEERKKVSKKAVESRGELPWVEGLDKKGRHYLGEVEYVMHLCEDPAYQHPSGQHQGKPNWRIIAAELNGKYHYGKPVRTPNAVKWQVCKARKKINK